MSVLRDHAVIKRLGDSEFFGIGLDQIGNFQKQAGAFIRRDGGSVAVLQRLARRRDPGIHIFGANFANLRDHRFRRRINRWKGAA